MLSVFGTRCMCRRWSPLLMWMRTAPRFGGRMLWLWKWCNHLIVNWLLIDCLIDIRTVKTRTIRQEPPYSQCRQPSQAPITNGLFDWEQQMFPFYYRTFYSVEACYRSCVQKTIIDACACFTGRCAEHEMCHACIVRYAPPNLDKMSSSDDGNVYSGGVRMCTIEDGINLLFCAVVRRKIQFSKMRFTLHVEHNVGQCRGRERYDVRREVGGDDSQMHMSAVVHVRSIDWFIV